MTRTLAWYLGCPPSFINLAMDMTCGGQVRTAEITSGAWPACLTVFVEPVKIQLTPKKPLPEEDAAKPFTVYVRTLTGKTFKTRCNANTTVHGLKEIVHTFEGAPPDQQRLIFNSLQLAGEDEYTLHDYDIGPDAVVNMVMKLRGGKPVIYVMPPKPMSVTVKVSLVPEWRFTTVYPVVPTIANPDGEHVEWTVDATPDGVLTTAGTQAMYLFWEGELPSHHAANISRHHRYHRQDVRRIQPRAPRRQHGHCGRPAHERSPQIPRHGPHRDGPCEYQFPRITLTYRLLALAPTL